MTPRFAVIAPDLARGVRAAIAVVVPFYLAAQLDMPALAWLALGGWLGALADPTGTRRARALAMAVFVIASTAVIAIAGTLAVQPVVAALFIAVIGFATSFARTINGPAGTIGNLVLLIAAIAGAGTGSPLEAAGLFAAGALWAVALSSIVWPGWPHLPLRVSLANAYRELAVYCEALTAASTDPTVNWSALAREHQRLVRAALEHTRETMLALRARRSGETPVGTNLRVLLGDAELHFFRVVALAEEVEAGRDREVLAELALTYRGIAERLMTRVAGEPARTEPITRGSALARGLVVWARKALVRARDLDVLGADAPRSPVANHPYGPLAAAVREAASAVREAASWRSPICRHAVRVAITCAVAYAVGRAASPTHSTWVTVTAIAVLQPYLGATLVRIVERVIGTIIGGAIAVGVMMTVHDQRIIALLMVPLAVAAVITRTRSYRMFVLLLTPVFVLVTNRWHPGYATAVVRIADVALGGALAGVAALIAPSTERERLPEALAALIDAIQRYVELTFEIVPTAADRAPLAAARRTVGIAFENAEASLERMLAEPRPLRRGNADAVVLLTYGRRLTAALTGLDEARRDERPALPDLVKQDVLVALAQARAHVTAGTTIERGVQPAAPALGADPALDKLVHYAALVRQVAYT
jgi:uncharacterized membrane protein YccC